MSTAPTPGVPARRRWVWRGLAVAVILAGAGGGAWWYFRPAADSASEPPAVDLSKADPEVARVIQRATDEVRAKPRDAGAWGKLGMLLLAHDFDTESRAVFHRAAELDPADYRWPYLEGLTRVLYEPEAGLERLRRAAELAPANRPEPRLRVAELLLERGDLAGAASLAERAPGVGRAELVLARVAAARGDWAAVLSRTDRCASDALCARESALLRGRAFAARGESERADAEFRAAAALREPPAWPDPVVADVESLRGGTAAQLAFAAELIDQGRAPEAVPVIEGVVARAPNSPEPTLLLGRALIRAGNAVAARQVLESYALRFPASVEGWFSLGVARFQTGAVPEAVEAFRQTIRLKSDHALAHFNLGLCHRKLGDKGAAKAAFEEALRCRPDHQPSRDALAELAAGK